MEDNEISDPSADFGELFEGEGEVFESSLSEAEVLGLENGIGIVIPTTSQYNHQQRYTTMQHQQQFIHQQQQMNQNQQISIQIGDPVINIKSEDESFQPESVQYIQEEYLAENHDDDEHLIIPHNSNEFESSDSTNVTVDEGGSVVVGTEIVHSSVVDYEPKKKTRVVKDVDHFARLNINKYLKKRGYQEILVPKTISKGSLAEFIDPALFRSNAVSFGPNYKPEDIYEEMEKFWKFYMWIKARNLPMSTELKPMLMPMLVYFFRGCFLSGDVGISQKLMLEFSKRTMQEEKSKENYLIAIAMAKMKNMKGYEDKYLEEVYQKSHKFALSEWTFGQLKKFLTKLKRPVMTHILTSYFLIVMRSSQEVADALCDQSDDSDSNSNYKDSINSNNVQKVIDRLRGSVKPNLPSVIVYTTNGQPVCGAISQEATTVAYGMSTAGIRICSASSAKKLFSTQLQVEEDSQYSPSIKTLNGHEGGVYGLGFHPKTKLLFSVGQDKNMRAWNLNNENNIGCRAVYRGHLRPIWSLDISKSGQFIATGSMDTLAMLWVPERIDCVRILAGHYFDVDCVRFHPNESYLATGSVDKSVRFWSISDGNMVRVMTGSNGSISAIAFHSSGKYLAGGGDDGLILVWDIGEGKILAELMCLNYCKDLTFYGNMLVGCFRNGSIQVWNVRQIVGGDHLGSDSYYSIPSPYTVECQASSLFKLYYKDASNLYCLGSDPILKEGTDKDSNEFSDNTKTSMPATPCSSSDSPMYIRLNAIDSALTSENVTPNSSTTNNNTPEEMENSLDELDAENTNHTITSSDMEFEVDDQMLESFVDEALQP